MEKNNNNKGREQEDGLRCKNEGKGKGREMGALKRKMRFEETEGGAAETRSDEERASTRKRQMERERPQGDKERKRQSGARRDGTSRATGCRPHTSPSAPGPSDVIRSSRVQVDKQSSW